MHFTKGKKSHSFIFFTLKMWCHLQAWVAGSSHGQDEVEWHSVLGREGCEPGLLSVSGIRLKAFPLPSQMNKWHCISIKELSVIWIWHCPLHNLLKVYLWCHGMSRWPLCSFHSPKRPDSVLLMLPHPRCSFYLPCRSWSRLEEKLHNSVLWGNTQLEFPCLQHPQTSFFVPWAFSISRMLGQKMRIN